MFMLKSQNLNVIINTLYVNPFPAILEGILSGGISFEEMIELETVRYLHRTSKSLLYTTNNKVLMVHYFPARATTTACIPLMCFTSSP